MSNHGQFPVFSRVLHWLMALMILAMLFIGVAMVASVGDYHRLVSIHRVLGVAILALVIVRIVNRRLNPPPALPPTLSRLQHVAAQASHILLYGLMVALPLVGWGMLSAANYPVAMFGPFVLPPILPHDPMLYAALRSIHTVLAYLLFATVLAHLGAALLHGLILRDGVFGSMMPWRAKPVRVADELPEA
ncbi:cytochrome b [Flaviflagellibacter deserti]|uniref:Cytochrome b n=1 Tax=Flaviflagellibacter deserti TaxID=2267266 RepID=A0ABV9YZI3_9HYPH